ncbi:hypothetical protein ACFO4E_13685 [Nocardiopsis mangrovi]|uniref:RanBP2-type domain-containing protein n=1 Tax=Nocardiopsis mangrovi TaxID=1179818 RepID=A0ABV9DXS0_9ACTN
MNNVERGRFMYGVRVAVPAGSDGHALLWFAFCPECQVTVNADRNFLEDCWSCGAPLPRRFNSRFEARVDWVLLDDVLLGRRRTDSWYCGCCGTENPIPDTSCPTCRRTRHSTGA